MENGSEGERTEGEGERELKREMIHGERDSGRRVRQSETCEWKERENKLVKNYKLFYNTLIHIRGYYSIIVKSFTIGSPGNACFCALMLKYSNIYHMQDRVLILL